LFGPAAAGVVGLYQALAQAPDNLIAQDTSAQRLLGITPRSVSQWLADVIFRRRLHQLTGRNARCAVGS